MRRRDILLKLPLVVIAPLSAERVSAQSVELKETDPEALAVSYHSNAKKVDPAKNPKFRPGQSCLSCGLFVPQPDSPLGGCQLFYGKDVAAAGWCNVWEAKP